MQCPTYSSSVLDFSINRRGNCKLEKEEDKAKKEKAMKKLLEQETTNIKTKQLKMDKESLNVVQSEE